MRKAIIKLDEGHAGFVFTEEEARQLGLAEGDVVELSADGTAEIWIQG